MRTSLLLFFLFSTLPLFGQSPIQAPRWVIPPLTIDFAGPIPTTSNIPGAPTNYNTANGAFDPAGNLLFYVVDDKILDASSNLITNINAPSFNSSSASTQNHMIVRVPGSCDEYYVIYNNPVTGNTPLFFTRLRHLASGTVTTVAGQVDVNFGNGNQFINTFAVTNLRSDNTRKLYNGSENLIQVFSISNTGISFQNSTNISFSQATIPIELDLNHSDDRLAISSFLSPLVLIADLNNNGNLAPGFQQIPVPNIQDTRGVEFSASGNQLVFSGGTFGGLNSGINIADLTQTPATITHLSGSSSFARSQIELGYDEKMYFSDGSTLAALDLNTNLINSSVLSLTGVGTDLSNHIITLPHQIDGQNYYFPELVDLWIADNPVETGVEPNPNPGYIWKGDVWNCPDQTNINCSLASAGDPEFKMYGVNYIRATVRNRGVCPSRPANLHLYWTFARTGELWDEHWLDPQLRPSNKIGTCPGGGEITADPSATSVPITIPSVAGGGTVTLSHSWQPQNPSCYPFGTPNGHFNSNRDPMICLLARVISDEDPILYEELDSIYPNLYKNNNIATRNFYLVNLNPTDRIAPGGAISLFNSHDFVQLMDIRISDVTPPGNSYPPFVEIGDLQLILDTEIWNAWVNTGMQGEGIEVISEGVIQINDLNNAILHDIEVGPAQGHPMTLQASMPEDYLFTEKMTYEFMLSHETDIEPNGNSAGVYRFQVTPDCSFPMNSEEAVNYGECIMIGAFADCTDCTFNWYPEAGLSNPNEARTEACIDVTTTYTLTVISPSGCEFSKEVTVYVLDQSSEFAAPNKDMNASADQQFWLFPNPAKDFVSAEFQLDQSAEVEILIYNQLGQQVSTPHPKSQLAKGYHQIRISASDLTPGLYFCELVIGEEKSTRQLVITK